MNVEELIENLEPLLKINPDIDLGIDIYEINGGIAAKFEIEVGKGRTITIINTRYWEEQEIEVF